MNLFSRSVLIKISAFLLKLFVIYLALLTDIEGKPQDIFQTVGIGAVQIAAQAAEIVSKGGALRDDRGIEVPFVKAHSKNEAGVGEAIIQRNYDDDSSEEDRRRRKRSLDTIYMNLVKAQSSQEIESFLPQLHFHRYKRAACHGGGGSTGGAGTGGAGDDVDDIDVVERRRKAARKRKAAQQKKARNAKKTTGKSKKQFVNDEEDAAQTLSRRKRQSEVDDLNENGNSVSKDFSQHAQEFAEKVRTAWGNMVNSMNQMAEKIKQAFTGGAGGGGDQMTGDI